MASDPFFEGAMYSSVNIVGIVICLLGILVHVLTKAMQVEGDFSTSVSVVDTGVNGCNLVSFS